MFHEIIGTLMMVLMILHLVQNRKWLVSMSDMQKPFQRVSRLQMKLFPE